MARNGSGTYSRVEADYVANTTILSGSINSELDDIATEITNSLAKDGQTPTTAVIPFANGIDMAGTRIDLDDDNDTSIIASTDDQIDIEIAGANDFQFIANSFIVQTGSNIDMNGGKLILDANQNTSITADTDDQIDIEISGADDFRFTANTFTALTGSSIVQTDGTMYVGDTANADMTLGVTINQGTNDDQIFALKSSTDVVHGMTNIAEADTYMAVEKIAATTGGALISAFDDTAAKAYIIRACTTASDATRSSIGVAPIELRASKDDTAAGLTTHGSTNNLVSWSDNGSQKGFFDAAGDIHLDGTSNDTVFDSYGHDALLVRAFDHERAPDQVIRDEFDAFVEYGKEDLEQAGIMSAEGFVNITQLQRLHNGAIWQLWKENQKLQRKLEEMDERYSSLVSGEGVDRLS